MGAKKQRQFVIVRSSPSGVWFGVLESVEGTPDGLERVVLSDARRCWQWTGAGSCSGLAAHGPLGGKIAVPIAATISHVCERLACAPEAVARFAEIAPWKP